MSITKTESRTSSFKNIFPLPKQSSHPSVSQKFTCIKRSLSGWHQHTLQNKMRNNCCDREDRSCTRSCLQGHIVTSSWLAYNWKQKIKSHCSVSTSNLSSFLQLHWFNADTIQKKNTSRAQYKFSKCCSEVDNSFCVWERKKKQTTLCINSKAAVHLHAMSQTTRDNRTLGTRIWLE